MWFQSSPPFFVSYGNKLSLWLTFLTFKDVSFGSQNLVFEYFGIFDDSMIDHENNQLADDIKNILYSPVMKTSLMK